MGAYKAVYIKIFRAGEGCKAVDSDLSVDKASMRILCLKLSLRNTHTLRVPGFDARARLDQGAVPYFRTLLSNLTLKYRTVEGAGEVGRRISARRNHCVISRPQRTRRPAPRCSRGREPMWRTA